jgi:hypothetical protein
MPVNKPKKTHSGTEKINFQNEAERQRTMNRAISISKREYEKMLKKSNSKIIGSH